ncbi:MAG: HAD family hydrolase [Phycisphaerales bacterium]
MPRVTTAFRAIASSRSFIGGVGALCVAALAACHSTTATSAATPHTPLAEATAAATTSPLASWNDGAAKNAIVEFVRAATDPTNPSYIEPAERIATFDNDGTLWVEQPMYAQVLFAFDRVRALAPQHPEWATEEPFRAILADDRAAMARFTSADLGKILAATHAGMTVAQYQALAGEWLSTAKHPRYGRPYTELVYEPMLELLRYLRANDFKTYIVTGGGQDFVRTFADRIYGVPPEQVVGSAGRTEYRMGADGTPEIVKLPEILFVDDKAGKPEAINLMIGRRPVAAFGNSTGDRQMLEWSQGRSAWALLMLVHHDDAVREYAYGAGSPIGTFSDDLMAEAAKRGWIVVSMKDDWKRIFPSEIAR